MDWKDELQDIIRSAEKASRAERENAAFERFLTTVATPALCQIAEEMKKLGCEAKVREASGISVIQVMKNETEEDINFSICRHFVNDGILPYAQVRWQKSQRNIRYETPLRPEGTIYKMSDVTADDVIRVFLQFYRKAKES